MCSGTEDQVGKLELLIISFKAESYEKQTMYQGSSKEVSAVFFFFKYMPGIDESPLLLKEIGSCKL